MKSPIYTALYDAIHSAIESAYYDDTTTIHDYAHVATTAAMKACGCAMTDPRETLKANIALVIEGLKHLDIGSAADLIHELADDMAEGGPEDLFHGAILDGIRWGYTAAVTVEMSGGAMLRVLLPGGLGVTHQWDNERDAQTQIKTALESLRSSRAADAAHWANTLVCAEVGK